MTFLGASVLELEPDRSDAAQDDLQGAVETFDPGTGARLVTFPADVDPAVFDFRWTSMSRAEALTLRNFVTAQAGRAIPFWFPDWHRVFDLVATQVAGTAALVVVQRGYAVRVWPAGRSRRFLAIRPPGGAFSYHEVTAAVDNGDTETLVISPTLPADCAPDTLICFLRYVRMDTDEPSIEWSGGHYATTIIPFRELPQEIPA